MQQNKFQKNIKSHIKILMQVDAIKIGNTENKIRKICFFFLMFDDVLWGSG